MLRRVRGSSSNSSGDRVDELRPLRRLTPAVRYTPRMKSSPADDEAARKDRAANRGRMTGRVLTLGEEEPREATHGTSAERISLLVELTEAAWAMTGQPWPSLPRAQWPGRVRLLGEVP